MQLSEQAIKEFQEIYHREFQEALSNTEARETAESFLQFMKIICRPIPGVKYQKKKNNPDKMVGFDKASEKNKMEV